MIRFTGCEAKASVVRRVSQHHDGLEAEMLALFEAGAHKRRPDAAALMLWRNRQWPKAHDLSFGVVGEDKRGKTGCAGR